MAPARENAVNCAKGRDLKEPRGIQYPWVEELRELWLGVQLDPVIADQWTRGPAFLILHASYTPLAMRKIEDSIKLGTKVETLTSECTCKYEDLNINSIKGPTENYKSLWYWLHFQIRSNPPALNLILTRLSFPPPRKKIGAQCDIISTVLFNFDLWFNFPKHTHPQCWKRVSEL